MKFLRQFTINRLMKKLKSLQQSRALSQPNEDSLKKEKGYYHTLADIYASYHNPRRHPFAQNMVLECYRAAATLDDSEAQYTLGNALLEEAKQRERLQNNGVFASKSNEKRMQQLYEEAHAYLTSADKLNHILARRLRGMCYINGWGVEANQDQGFELVVSSIEQGNSWDKVPEIFESLGLNKPEFYAALTKHRTIPK